MDRETELDVMYTDALALGDLKEIEAVEQLIANEVHPRSSLWFLAMSNVSARMTPQDWQNALSDVCANIVSPPALPDDMRTSPTPPANAKE